MTREQVITERFTCDGLLGPGNTKCGSSIEFTGTAKENSETFERSRWSYGLTTEPGLVFLCPREHSNVTHSFQIGRK